ncbi:DUF4124 domain-containing protein [Stutzerimonas nosocomialis]|uniref:DUF4124 domain-containing protein n=1 Tax=Stutzerimonas nosocomialis TaxID=1056496 RepID=A0A5R9QEF1_9GAMM|nr:DUF4124 domain-containing protein [Stutzerimonas nosocomialis]TLX54292.1 DUF4124 domain-containing protein [Stutzerimonas nosocomialis]TLX58755.1 DUF4124 domain-containing protein [Stutzerimonas nosocomialis]TLX63278.1 DUF4124 domain-containing protein [Stutzerimonas nosocomialis]
MRALLASLMLLAALPAAAQIYKYTDANGNTVFTNQPPDGVSAESVELPPTNTVDIKTPAPPPPLPSDSERAKAAAPYSQLALVGIPDEEALRANNGTFSVGVSLEPALRPGHSLRLLLDGQPYGQPSNVPMLQLVNVDRGEHSLAVEVLADGRSIQQSAPETFTIQRVNTSSPALRPKPTPPAPPKKGP